MGEAGPHPSAVLGVQRGDTALTAGDPPGMPMLGCAVSHRGVMLHTACGGDRGGAAVRGEVDGGGQEVAPGGPASAGARAGQVSPRAGQPLPRNPRGGVGPHAALTGRAARRGAGPLRSETWPRGLAVGRRPQAASRIGRRLAARASCRLRRPPVWPPGCRQGLSSHLRGWGAARCYLQFHRNLLRSADWRLCSRWPQA